MSSTAEPETAAAELRDLAPTIRECSQAVQLAAVTAHAWGLPAIIDAEHVAELLGCDLKAVYEAVRDRGLPMRPVGKKKGLRGLTVAVLLWLLEVESAHGGRGTGLRDAVDSDGQGRVVRTARGRR